MRKKRILKLTIFTAAVFGLGFFAFSGEARAAGNTYYASPTGSEATCSDTVPCALSYGVNTKASSGDTVIAKAGTYHESLTITKAGVILQGELDGSRNRLSSIDPYIDASGSWTETGNAWADIGDGVWQKNFAYPVYAMNIKIGGVQYKIPRLCLDSTDPAEMHGGNFSTCNGTGQNSWKYWLTVPNMSGQFESTTLNSPFDGYEGWFVCLNSAPYTCYIRFRDAGTNINALSLEASQNTWASIIVSASDVTIKNFDVKAVLKGISVGGTSSAPVTANNATIQNNKVSLGRIKVWVTASGDNSLITENEMVDFSYADSYPSSPSYQWKRGAGGTPDMENNYDYMIKRWHYLFDKYHITPDGNSYVSSGVFTGSGSTEADIISNYIHDLHNAIDIYTVDNISNNTIKNITQAGIVTGVNMGTLIIANNDFEDVLSPTRFMWFGGESPQNGNGVNNSTVYFYGNKIWNPTGATRYAGEGIVYHHVICSAGDNCGITTPAKVYVYHNSFSGNNRIVGMNSQSNYTPSSLTGIKYYNNIMSSGRSVMDQCCPGIGAVGKNWSYSYLGNYGPFSSIYGENINGTAEMEGWTVPYPHDFDVTGTAAEGAGCKMDDNTYPYDCGQDVSALPGVSAGYYYGSATNIGAVQSSPADVDGSGRVNIKDIQICIKAIVDPGSFITPDQLNQLAKCQAVALPDTVANIKDIQAIIRKIINRS